MPNQVSRRRRPQQLTFARHGGWGGPRKGAGRKPRGERPGVSHATRGALAARFPVHVTLRVLPHVWNLRSRRSFRVIARAFAAGGDRFGMRLCEYSIQGNHLHLLVEAADQRALSRGMQGLSIRLARGLNALMGRQGKVLADRFHARILRSPTEVKRVLAYVRDNRDIHRARRGEKVTGKAADPYSSASRDPSLAVVLPEAHSWLLARARAEHEAPA